MTFPYRFFIIWYFVHHFRFAIRYVHPVLWPPEKSNVRNPLFYAGFHLDALLCADLCSLYKPLHCLANIWNKSAADSTLQIRVIATWKWWGNVETINWIDTISSSNYEVRGETSMGKYFLFFLSFFSFGHTLESLVSFVCLVELVLFTLMLCVLLASFLVVIETWITSSESAINHNQIMHFWKFIFQMDNVMSKIATCIYIFCILYALFIPYWHANEFSWEVSRIIF